MAHNQEIIDLTSRLRTALNKQQVTQDEVNSLINGTDGHLQPAFLTIASTDPKAPMGVGNDDEVQGVDVLLNSLKSISTSPEDNSEAIALIVDGIARTTPLWSVAKPKGLRRLLHKSDVVTLGSFIEPVLNEAVRAGHPANFGAVFQAVPDENKPEVARQYLGQLSSISSPDLDKPTGGPEGLDVYMAKAAILDACLPTHQDLGQIQTEIGANLENDSAQETGEAETKIMDQMLGS